MISLFNDVRIAAELPTLGFLNLWLYAQVFKCLSDIVEGSNPGWCTNRFTAVKGWDPFTGLGMHNFRFVKDLSLNGTTVGNLAYNSVRALIPELLQIC